MNFNIQIIYYAVYSVTYTNWFNSNTNTIKIYKSLVLLYKTHLINI